MNIRNLIVLLMVSTGLFAQTVNGTVYDSNSRPLEGANVVLVGTELGDTANADGAYAMLNVPAGTYEVVCWQEKFKKKVIVDKVTVGSGPVTKDFTFTRPKKK